MANFWDVTHVTWWHVCHIPMCIIAITAREAWRQQKGQVNCDSTASESFKCNILYNFLHCILHNANCTCNHSKYIYNTGTAKQLYFCVVKLHISCQLNCVVVGDGADYGSCWVWRGAKRGVEGWATVTYSSILNFHKFWLWKQSLQHCE